VWDFRSVEVQVYEKLVAFGVGVGSSELSAFKSMEGGARNSELISSNSKEI
jgi:hypothetical protein